MHNNSFRNDEAIPQEFRAVTSRLFSEDSNVEMVGEFADALGVGGEYKRMLGDADISETHKRLAHFKNNLALLIQKTWVERMDESRKEKLQDQVPGFIKKIECGDYADALKDFNNILNELAYLFFGAQSKREDFTEYTFRIDTQIGLFWWYGNKLGSFRQTDSCYLKALLMLGVCYLTNF